MDMEMGMVVRKGGSWRRFRLLPTAVATALLILVLGGCTAARNAVSPVGTESGKTLSSTTPSAGTPGSTTPGANTPGTTTGGSVLVATLKPEGTNTSGSGTARLVLSPKQQSICFVIHVTGIALPSTETHIHQGAAGITGPVVVPLTPPNAQGVSTGCAHVSQDIINTITQHPAQYYVNVHNAHYPEGAVRGQLSTCGPHMSC